MNPYSNKEANVIELFGAGFHGTCQGLIWLVKGKFLKFQEFTSISNLIIWWLLQQRKSLNGYVVNLWVSFRIHRFHFVKFLQEILLRCPFKKLFIVFKINFNFFEIFWEKENWKYPKQEFIISLHSFDRFNSFLYLTVREFFKWHHLFLSKLYIRIYFFFKGSFPDLKSTDNRSIKTNVPVHFDYKTEKFSNRKVFRKRSETLKIEFRNLFQKGTFYWFLQKKEKKICLSILKTTGWLIKNL